MQQTPASNGTSDGTGKKRQHCLATRRDGLACQAPALPGSDRCVFHSPLGQGGRSKGGQGKLTSARADRLLPKRLRPLVELLDDATRQAMAGTLVSPQAHLIAPLARALIAAYTAGQQEEALHDLQAQIVELQASQTSAMERTSTGPRGVFGSKGWTA